MYDAARNGNGALVKSLLEQGANVNYKDSVRRRIHIIYTIILFEIR